MENNSLLRRHNWRSEVLWATQADVTVASDGFDASHPHASAKSLTADMMLEGLAAYALILGLGVVASPILAVEVIVCFAILMFAVISIWRIGLMASALVLVAFQKQKPINTDSEILPTYTILLPAYKEAGIMGQLCTAMFALNYPRDKLDIIVLVEEQDKETRAVASRLPWPGEARIIVVPEGKPQTKPRALNVGLRYARGSFLTIYDAEDRPHPNQLREAVAAFDCQDIGCVQAPLRADRTAQIWAGANWEVLRQPFESSKIEALNDKRGSGPVRSVAKAWLAGQWGMEYLLQFTLLQPALARFGLPIMLGGTSNHFRTRALRKLGGWDAWNVTEDAELGIRFAREGLRVKTISSPTLETPPDELRVWLGQRSRWIKGFMQTWVTYRRHQRVAGCDLNVVQKFSVWVLLAGMILSTFAFLPGLVLFGAGLVTNTLPIWMAAPFLFTMSASAILAIFAPAPWQRGRGFCALTQALYWPLHTIAACMALKCFFKNPSFWNKTQH